MINDVNIRYSIRKANIRLLQDNRTTQVRFQRAFHALGGTPNKIVQNTYKQRLFVLSRTFNHFNQICTDWSDWKCKTKQQLQFYGESLVYLLNKIYVKTCKEIKFITNMREQVNIETSKELEEKEDCYSVIALLVKRIAKLDE